MQPDTVKRFSLSNLSYGSIAYLASLLGDVVVAKCTDSSLGGAAVNWRRSAGCVRLEKAKVGTGVPGTFGYSDTQLTSESPLTCSEC